MQDAIHDMFQSQNRMPDHHSRPGIAHHVTDPIPHSRLVTVNRAIGALRLIGAKGAVLQSRQGIPLQFGTLPAQGIAGVMQIPAVEPDHGTKGGFFALKP